VPTEAEMLAVRLAYMKRLLDGLEEECAESGVHHRNFVKLKRELAAARAALKIIDSSRS
jgi:hypothetical protein